MLNVRLPTATQTTTKKVEIKLYKQRVKHLLHEHQDEVARTNMAAEISLKLAQVGSGRHTPPRLLPLSSSVVRCAQKVTESDMGWAHALITQDSVTLEEPHTRKLLNPVIEPIRQQVSISFTRAKKGYRSSLGHRSEICSRRPQRGSARRASTAPSANVSHDHEYSCWRATADLSTSSLKHKKISALIQLLLQKVSSLALPSPCELRPPLALSWGTYRYC